MFHSLVTSTILWSLAVLAPISKHLRDAPLCTTFLLARCQLYSMCLPRREALDPLLLHALGPSAVGTTMELVGAQFAQPLHFNSSPDPRESDSHEQIFWPSACAPRAQQLCPPNFEFFYVGSGTNRLTCRRQLASRWLCRFGVCPAARHVNLLQCASTDYFPDDYGGIQGCFHGQQIFFDFHSSWSRVGSLQAGPNGRLERDAFDCLSQLWRVSRDPGSMYLTMVSPQYFSLSMSSFSIVRNVLSIHRGCSSGLKWSVQSSVHSLWDFQCSCSAVGTREKFVLDGMSGSGWMCFLRASRLPTTGTWLDGAGEREREIVCHHILILLFFDIHYTDTRVYFILSTMVVSHELLLGRKKMQASNLEWKLSFQFYKDRMHQTSQKTAVITGPFRWRCNKYTNLLVGGMVSINCMRTCTCTTSQKTFAICCHPARCQLQTNAGELPNQPVVSKPPSEACSTRSRRPKAPRWVRCLGGVENPEGFEDDMVSLGWVNMVLFFPYSLKREREVN